MDGRRIGQHQLIQLTKAVIDVAAVEIDAELAFLHVDARHDAEIAVVDVLVVIVLDLHDLVARFRVARTRRPGLRLARGRVCRLWRGLVGLAPHLGVGAALAGDGAPVHGAWGSLLVGASIGVIVAPPVIVVRAGTRAPPPIVAGLPNIRPPPIVAAPPPVAAPSVPAVAAPPVGPLLGATVPPPIVILPPPKSSLRWRRSRKGEYPSGMGTAKNATRCIVMNSRRSLDRLLGNPCCGGSVPPAGEHWVAAP